jgi:hypothetical protein
MNTDADLATESDAINDGDRLDDREADLAQLKDRIEELERRVETLHDVNLYWFRELAKRVRRLMDHNNLEDA